MHVKKPVGRLKVMARDARGLVPSPRNIPAYLGDAALGTSLYMFPWKVLNSDPTSALEVLWFFANLGLSIAWPIFLRWEVKEYCWAYFDSVDKRAKELE